MCGCTQHMGPWTLSRCQARTAEDASHLQCFAAPAETPSKRRVAASPARPFPSELKASLDKLRLHVQSLPPMAAGEKRQLPRSVNPQLDTMSCIIHRHSLPVGCATAVVQHAAHEC